MKIEDTSAYPRPQFRRKSWLCLDGEWQFAYDDELRARIPAEVREWPMRIRVPFAPESRASGIHDTGFHRACWYQREFDVPLPSLNGFGHPVQRTLLHFGAVDYHARVWVNETLVADHEGGHTPFIADISRALGPGPQKLTVRAYDDPFDLEKPRGKQDWRLEPHSIWYPRTTGIWQTVWLEQVPDTYIETLWWAPNLERWEIGLHGLIRGRAEGTHMTVTLRIGETVLAEDSYRVMHNEVHRRIGLSDPGIDDYRNELLWSPERPTLIEADITLERDGDVLEEIESYTALLLFYHHDSRADRRHGSSEPLPGLSEGRFQATHVVSPWSSH